MYYRVLNMYLVHGWARRSYQCGSWVVKLMLAVVPQTLTEVLVRNFTCLNPASTIHIVVL